MKYRLVIFDSDGTLADTLPWIRSVFNELAEEYGFRKVEPHEYERFRNLHGASLLRELELPLWKLPRVASGLRARMARHVSQFGLFPGVSEVLHRLAGGGIQLAVVSSNSRSNVTRILGPRNSKLVAFFACGASIFGKGARLRRLIGASGIPREQALYIGDEVRDAEAAQQAKVSFGAVGWGQHHEEVLRACNPAEFFRTVHEIADRLSM